MVDVRLVVAWPGNAVAARLDWPRPAELLPTHVVVQVVGDWCNVGYWSAAAAEVSRCHQRVQVTYSVCHHVAVQLTPDTDTHAHAQLTKLMFCDRVRTNML